MNKISLRQLLFFLACVTPVGKIIFMPSHLAYYAKNDLLFSALINYALQAAIIFLVLLLSKHNQTFYELLENSIGKIGARIVMIVFAMFLFFAAFLPLTEQKQMVQSAFYDTLPNALTFAPYFLLAAYLCYKSLSSMGRTWDFLAPFALVGFLGIFVLSAGNADFGALLPVGASGAKGIFSGALFSMSWFFDSALLLLLIGRFDYKKGLAWKGALCYLGGGILVLFFLSLFYGIFIDLSIRQLFAFSKVSKYFSGVGILGRIDYFFIYTLALVMIFYCALPLQAGIQGIRDAFGDSKPLALALAVGVNALMFLFFRIFQYNMTEISKTVTQTLCWIFPVFSVLIPLLALLLLIKRRKKDEQD